MLVSVRTVGFALTVSAAVLVGSALPTLADTPLGHTGKVGAHSLSDTASHPGATCRYKVSGPYGDYAQNVRIVVKPPNMRPVAGDSSQKVGWRFTVQRRNQGEEGSPPWHNDYTSPLMTAVTSDAHNASFTSASVPVKAGPPETGGDYQYRVIVTMIWERSDGSTQGKARNRIDYYKGVLNTGGTNLQDNQCWGHRYPNQFN